MALNLFKKKNQQSLDSYEADAVTDSLEKPDEFEDGITKDPVEVSLGFFKRLLGDWPLFEQPPLTQSHFKKLFATRPAFVDYFPFEDYDQTEKVFVFNDEVSCGAVFDVIAPDLDARSTEEIERFCTTLNNVLTNAMPIDEGPPYILQFYLEDRTPKNIAEELKNNANDFMKDHAFGEAWFEAMHEHFAMMSNSHGIFPDDRNLGSSIGGWRAINRKLTLVIYRKATKGEWLRNKNKRDSSFKIFNRSIENIVQGLASIGCIMNRFDESDLYEWLTPWFNPNPVGFEGSAVDWVSQNPLAPPEERGYAFDLAQMVCPEPPRKLDPYDSERGIMKFGDTYSRYVTLQPIYSLPKQGIYTTDTVTSSQAILASLWDRAPSESIMVWTLIPQNKQSIQRRLEVLEGRCIKDKTESATSMKEQISPAKKHLLQGTQSIFYYQVGMYLKADSIERLDEHYHQATSLLDSAMAMKAIKEEHDLFPTDSYIRNMPFVFDWNFDRKHALRAFMAYSSHVAATLPLYGRSRGSKNACMVNYNRSGEIIRINPYHKEDKSRVSHSILFGPTGAGKSATQVSQSMQSMAVNYPRQFFIDKGGSFSLLGDFYERMGLKVRRIYFQTSTDICMPPFAETKMALMEARGELVSSDDDEDDDEEERRSYLAEMMNAALLMITGGNQKIIDDLNNQDKSFIQEGIIMALEVSSAENNPHARPMDLVDALKVISKREGQERPQLGDRINQFADSVNLWTVGPRGHFFNRFGTGFSDEDDVVILELGVLTEESSEDMLAVAMSALITAITQMGEKHQYSGRHVECYMDECHYVTANPLLVNSVVVGVKTWRKINIWLNLATQNIADFPDHAKKILQLLEFWWLLTMEPEEATKIKELLELPIEVQRIIKQCKKTPPYYVEGVLLSKKFAPMLLRFVPPALCLALGFTDGDEKKKIQTLREERGISRLDAAIELSRQIVESRKAFSPDY